MLLFLFALFFHANTVSLQLSFNNIREAKGAVYIAVFSCESDFLNTDKVVARRIVPVQQTGNLEVSLEGLPPGQYAVSSFQDVNGNGKLDTNLFGIPTEPYGFSNNARPKFRAPNWMEAAFQLNANSRWQQITLARW